MIDLTGVKKLKQVDIPVHLQMYQEATNGIALAGHFFDYLFIVTQDPDGKTEMSITSKDSTRRPSDKVMMAFISTCFPGQSISVSETERPSKRVRHLVLRQRISHV